MSEINFPLRKTVNLSLTYYYFYDFCEIPKTLSITLELKISFKDFFFPVYPEVKSFNYIESDTCTPVFIGALFTIARWKQPRCSLADEWIRKLWYIYAMKYYSAIKGNAFDLVLIRWMNLEPIIQCEVRQEGKDKYWILMHIYEI